MNAIPDLNLGLTGLGVLLDVDVDRKVRVHVAHLVQEAARDTGDQVVDDAADGPERGDALAGPVVHLNRDNVRLRTAEGDGKMGEVLDQLAWCEFMSVLCGWQKRRMFEMQHSSKTRKSVEEKRTSGSLDGHDPRTNVHLHCRGQSSISEVLFLVVALPVHHTKSTIRSSKNSPEKHSSHISMKSVRSNLRLFSPVSSCVSDYVSRSLSLSLPLRMGDKNQKLQKLTIVRDGQPFLGVNVPHLDCVTGGIGRGGELSIVERIIWRCRRGGAKFQVTGLCVAYSRLGLVSVGLHKEWYVYYSAWYVHSTILSNITNSPQRRPKPLI